jgi:glutaredoxin
VSDGAPPPVQVVLYGAAACSLCETAKATLRVARDDLGFSLEEVDIGDRAELEARYRASIPVVEIDGVQAFALYVSRSELERWVGAAQARRSAARS